MPPRSSVACSAEEKMMVVFLPPPSSLVCVCRDVALPLPELSLLPFVPSFSLPTLPLLYSSTIASAGSAGIAAETFRGDLGWLDARSGSVFVFAERRDATPISVLNRVVLWRSAALALLPLPKSDSDPLLLLLPPLSSVVVLCSGLSRSGGGTSLRERATATDDELAREGGGSGEGDGGG